MPDSWAINHLFPVLPLHRHREQPTRRGILADITCDSDGKLSRFTHLRDDKHTLELHSANGKPYYIGAFLVGAYQEILGDLHNLFGDTHAVHVALGPDGKPVVKHLVEGDTVREVLSYVQYSPDELLGRLRAEVGRAIEERKLLRSEGDLLLGFYRSGLEGYTYLEDGIASLSGPEGEEV
jgi:arginine decarboxylase